MRALGGFGLFNSLVRSKGGVLLVEARASCFLFNFKSTDMALLRISVKVVEYTEVTRTVCCCLMRDED